jgi:hypothetical protein
MTKHYLSLLALLVLSGVALGCGLVSRIKQDGSAAVNSNKSLGDQAVERAIGDETTGVPECDEVLKMLAAEADSPDDGYVAKAVKGTFLNKIKESIRTSIEQNKNDKAGLAKNCREFKTQLINYKADSNSKKAK